jgi:hypothetical protein
MGDTQTSLPIGQQVSLPGHFDVPVTLETTRPLANGYECRVRSPDGTLDEAVITQEGSHGARRCCPGDREVKPDAEPLRIQNPAKQLDHAKEEFVAARYFDIPAIAVEQAAQKG